MVLEVTIPLYSPERKPKGEVRLKNWGRGKFEILYAGQSVKHTVGEGHGF